MRFLRRILILAVKELVQNPKARAKAAQTLEEHLKPQAQYAWRVAKPKIKSTKIKLKDFTQKVYIKYRKGGN